MNDSKEVKEILNDVHSAYDYVSTTTAALSDATDPLPPKYQELKDIAREIDRLSVEFERKFYALTGY